MDDEFRAMYVMALMPIMGKPPPSCQDISRMVGTVIMFLTRPPPDPLLDIRRRLFPRIDNDWHGRDVVTSMISHPYEFYMISSETPETFLELCDLIHNFLDNQITHRAHKLTVHNRVLLFFIWVRTYPTYYFLSLMFCVSYKTIANEIDTMWPIMWEIIAGQVEWPGVDEWRSLQGVWEEIPSAVGAIDGTSHQIYRPVEHQEQFYSGHRHVHCIHTQVVIDNEKRLRLVTSGFRGHANDAQTYQLMGDIGPGLEYDFPDDCYILADKAYPNRHPLMTAYRAAQVRLRQAGRPRRLCRLFNRTHSQLRVYVEHVIRQLKIYRVIGSLFRHPRWKMTAIVDICAGLATRRVDNGLHL